MNLQVYVSYNPMDETAIEALARTLRRHSISVIRNSLVAPDANATREVLGKALGSFHTVIVVVGAAGLSERQRTDLLVASELKLSIACVMLPEAERPLDMPASARLIQLGVEPADSDYTQLIQFIREPSSSHPTRGVLESKGGELAPPPDTSGAERSDVLLGAAAPRYVSPDSEFVARFTAYTEAHRGDIERILQAEAPRSAPMLDLASCQWAIGTKVTVSLAARGLEVDNSPQQFEWDGKWELLRFDIEVPSDRRLGTAILKFNVTIEGITVASLRPEIDVVAESPVDVEMASARQASPKTAFASYATQDREYVLGRVRSLEICTGMDIFVDCLSLRPAERWKAVLAEQILARDVFFLFWSRSAGNSPWVDWEWRTVLEKKGLDAIQPHPLEPLEVAPAPDELADLQFGNAFERYIMDLKEGKS